MINIIGIGMIEFGVLAGSHMIDHKYGAWYRILDLNNNKYDDLKSPAGKVDYHTMGACYEVMNILDL